MCLKWMRSISFQKKMTMIFTIVCAFSTGIAGILYYRYAQKEIIDNFTMNAKGLVDYLENTLNIRLQAVDRRAFAALTNSSFIDSLEAYLSAPDVKKEVIAAEEAVSLLKDIRQAEPLVHSTLIYTDKKCWNDYISRRNWAFHFEDSVFWDYFTDDEFAAIRWMPAMKDEIFQDEDIVLPYVRRFSAGHDGRPIAYLVIQLDQKELIREMTGFTDSLGEILITDTEGRYVAGTVEMSEEDLARILEADRDSGSDDSWVFNYQGENLLMFRGSVDINGWRIYVLKSEMELLNNIKKMRRLVGGMTILLVFACLFIVAIISRQLTFSLQSLAMQMNRMRNGEMEARYYYPYENEIGSLAKSFNYMADEIQRSMKKQEEYIQVLKEERDYIEQVQNQKRKAELRALQAQIKPHFLYNTLNMITWMASDQGADEIRMLSNALGRFFRISLSRGAEVISVRDEMEYIKNYLVIQEIRYAEMMRYEIDVPEELLRYQMLKLVLQPLVENSIYHGVKEKGGNGTIVIRAMQIFDGIQDCIRFVVEDDGMGIPKKQRVNINAMLTEGKTDDREGYGIFNVNERIRLYYGSDYGLFYESLEGEWTRAILTIPLSAEEEGV